MEKKPIGKISFGFSKIKKKSEIIPSNSSLETTSNIEYITSFEERKIDPNANQKPLITIPVNDEDGIKNRIMASRKKNETAELKPIGYEKTGRKESNNVIPLQETDTKISDEPADYERVSVDEFGFAMLRGMGWTPGKGIGKKQKVAEYREFELRPNGLGLGAGPDALLKKEEKDKEKEKKK